MFFWKSEKRLVIHRHSGERDGDLCESLPELPVTLIVTAGSYAERHRIKHCIPYRLEE